MDIDDKKLFKGVKQRLEMAKEDVSKAIKQFEEGKIESPENIQVNTKIVLLKKSIIDFVIKRDYQEDKISEIVIEAEKLKNDDLNGSLADLYYNWGNYLSDLAETKSGNEAVSLCRESFEKFKLAIDFKPDFQEALYNWGTSLGDLAKTKTGEEAASLYNQAFEKFKLAIDIKPDKHQPFYNWGTHLGYLAKTKTGEEAKSMYKEAFEIFDKAIDLSASSYNLACLYALKPDKKNALLYLSKCLKNREIDIEFVKEDEEWIDYLEDEEFKKIAGRYTDKKNEL